jgi:hypothetical protein
MDKRKPRSGEAAASGRTAFHLNNDKDDGGGNAQALLGLAYPLITVTASIVIRKPLPEAILHSTPVASTAHEKSPIARCVPARNIFG